MDVKRIVYKDQIVATFHILAELLESNYETVRNHFKYGNNRYSMIENDDFVIVKGKDLRYLCSKYPSLIKKSTSIMTLITFSGALKLFHFLKHKSNYLLHNLFDYYEQDVDGYIIYSIPRKEYDFYQSIQDTFKDLFVIQTQYIVGKYRLDMYIPDINLAIEFDERHHSSTVEEDRQRQKEIQQMIGCKFIRVSWNEPIENAINKILKEVIFSGRLHQEVKAVS